MSKHTPEPWKFFKNKNPKPHYNGCKGIPDPETTVPELLSALDQARQALLAYSNSGRMPEEFQTEDGYCQPLRLIENVLDKLEGGAK